MSTNPYVNLVNDRPSTWGWVAKQIAAGLVKHGVWKEPTVKTDGEWDFYGIYASKATRLSQLGWTPKVGTDQDLADGIDSEVQNVLIQQGKLASPKTGSRVLVTGASGYVGGAIALRLLEHPAELTVRLALRNKADFDAFIAHQPWYAGRLEFAHVPSITAPSAFDEAVKGVAYIAHAAS